MILSNVPKEDYYQNVRMSLHWRPKIEDWLANFEDLTLIFKEIEDSFMCREPQLSNAYRACNFFINCVIQISDEKLLSSYFYPAFFVNE